MTAKYVIYREKCRTLEEKCRGLESEMQQLKSRGDQHDQTVEYLLTSAEAFLHAASTLISYREKSDVDSKPSPSTEGR